jgi:hypothetical protein
MKLLLCFVIIVIMISCHHTPKCENGIAVHAVVLRTYNAKNINDTAITTKYDIRISLVNKSASEISFWMMSCSQEDSFIANTDLVCIEGTKCDKNVPEHIHLKPNDSLVCPITCKERFKHNAKPVQFGFKLIDAANFDRLDDFLNLLRYKSKLTTIVYSNPVNL